MVGYSSEEIQLSHTAHISAGALSGVLTRACIQPIDVLKIRFQLQVEPISKSSQISKYRGMFHISKTIFLEESWTAFWKGHLPSQSLSAVFMAVEFGSFEALTKYMYSESDSQSKRSMQHFVCGASAGSLATIVSYPFDLLRTRFAAQGNVKMYTSFYHACHHIYSTAGIFGFYKGLLPALYHSAPQSALYFGMYRVFKDATAAVIPANYTDSITAVSGAAAGVTSKLVVYPFDISKRRFQVIGFEEARKEFGATRYYKGVLDHIRVSLREEGVRGLYKGASWAFLKSGISTSMYFFIYEKICKMIRQHNTETEC